MWDRVPAVLADVEDQPVSPVGQSLGGRHLLGQSVHGSHVVAVLRADLGGVGDMGPRNHEDVGRHRGVEVSEGVGAVALGHDGARDLSAQDLAEQAVRVIGHRPGTVPVATVDRMGTGEDQFLDDVDDPFVSELRRILADANAEDLVVDRNRQRWLRQIAEEEATIAGVLLDLAERQASVLLRTVVGRSHRGRLVAAGGDFVVVREGQAPPVLVTHAGLSSVRPIEVGGRDTAGSRAAPLKASLAATMMVLATERPRVQVITAGNEHLVGGLRSAGTDVVTIRLESPDRMDAHVPTAGVVEVVLLDA